MKRRFYFLVVCLLLTTTKCSTVTEIAPSKLLDGKTNSGNLSGNNLIGAKRIDAPGELIWISTSGGVATYQADFAGLGILTFTGTPPAPGSNFPPASPTPSFQIQSSNLGQTTCYQGAPGTNTFSILLTGTVWAGNSGGEIDVTVEDGGEITDISAEPINDGASSLSVTFYGQVILLNGAYYAVTSDYQFPSQPKTAIVIPPHVPILNPITITRSIQSADPNWSVQNPYYSTDNGDTWTVLGTTAQVSSGSSVIFKATFVSLVGELVDMKIHTTPGVGVEDAVTVPWTGSYLYFSVPATGETFPSHVYTENFTVYFSLVYISVARQNNVRTPYALSNPQYSIDNIHWVAMNPTNKIGPLCSIYYRGTFANNSLLPADYTIVVAGAPYPNPLPPPSSSGATVTTPLIGPSITNYTASFNVTQEGQ